MTTTTSTTSSTTTSATTSATSQLLTSLNAGSGVDTAGLVSSLVTAQFAAKTEQLKSKTDTLTAQISGISTLKNAVSTFATALDTLVKGGTLGSQPLSGNTSVFTASAIQGSQLSALSSNIAVKQLASGQTAVSAKAFDSSTTNLGTGTLTLRFGEATYSDDGSSMTTFDAKSAPIDITITDGSLDKIAAAINAANKGVTAAVVTDADGTAYLSLKGATGKAQAFSMTGTDGLSALNVGPGASGSTMTSTARNAQLVVDGVSVERASNTVTDLVAGVKLQLTGTSSSPVSLTGSNPTDALKEAVTNFVDTYNEVMKLVAEQTDPINGALRADPAARSLEQSLKGLTQKVLVPGAAAGTPSTLAAIGVRTTKAGLLEVDTTALTRALTDAPAAVEQIFAFSSNGQSGISAALNSLSLNAGSTIYGLGASTLKYSSSQNDLSRQQDKLDDQRDQMTTRLTQQFSSMNSRVSAYKATQTYLTNQIAAWNKSDS